LISPVSGSWSGTSAATAALAAYARQRDDKDMECWVREIHLRACVRIGELVRELDTAEPGGATDGKRGGSTVQTDALSKDDVIADAGLSRRSAYDYQALAGGRDERAIDCHGICGINHAAQQVGGVPVACTGGFF